MSKIIKLLLSFLVVIIVYNGICLCILNVTPEGDLGAIPIILFLIIIYIISVSCLSVWGYKKTRSITVVNGLLFILNIATGYICYYKTGLTPLVYSIVVLGITLLCTLITKLDLFLNRKKGDNSNGNI